MTNEVAPPCYRAAREYIGRGWAVIPLVPGDKNPATRHGLNDWTDNPEQADVWWGQGKYRGRGNPSYNVGVVCGQVSGGLVVIDIDEGGDEVLRDWEGAHGRLPETVEQVTGSGGRHLFYRTGREIRPSVNGELHIDIRGDGSYVVAPPSIHPNGTAYEWSVSPDDMDVADANERVYAFIEFARPASMGEGERKPRFELPEAIESDRNSTLFRYASSLREKGLDGDAILAVLESTNAARCRPPLPEHEVRKIAGSVLRYEEGNVLKRPAGSSGTGDGKASIFDRPDEPAARMKDETVDKVLNTLLSLREVKDGLKLNSFDGRLHVLSPCIPGAPFERQHVLGTGESVKLRTVMERDYGIRNKQKFEDALLALGATEGQQFNPMRDLLDSLPKVRFVHPETVGMTGAAIDISRDGGETWERSHAVCGSLCSEYLGVEPSDYIIEAERLIFRQLVARAIRPGCKADYMAVFVGKQGTGKSTFVSLLALDQRFMLEGFSDFGVEDLKRIAGKLVVEIPELDGFTGKDKNKIKSVITQTSDNYRESYARTPVEHPRTALFFGTTNDGAFLNDNTGGRRYLLIESPKGMLGADKRLFDGTAAADIRQAWAETLALYEAQGEDEFLRSLVLPDNVAGESMKLQTKYTTEDSTREATMSYIEDCESNDIHMVNVKQVLMDGMGYSEYQAANAQRWIQSTITATLNDCVTRGWVDVGKRRNGRYGRARAWSNTPGALEGGTVNGAVPPTVPHKGH